jgi:hypothetical protein
MPAVPSTASSKTPPKGAASTSHRFTPQNVTYAASAARTQMKQSPGKSSSRTRSFPDTNRTCFSPLGSQSRLDRQDKSPMAAPTHGGPKGQAKVVGDKKNSLRASRPVEPGPTFKTQWVRVVWPSASCFRCCNAQHTNTPAYRAWPHCQNPVDASGMAVRQLLSLYQYPAHQHTRRRRKQLAKAEP